jgi:methyl-accepting chemotaxis protein
LTADSGDVLTRSIVAAGEAVRIAEVVAGGNLTQAIEVSGSDEPARLLECAKEKSMQQSLRSTIPGYFRLSTQLASASGNSAR